NTEKVDSCAKLYLAGSSVSSIKKALAIGSYETIYRFLALKGISPSRSRFRKK
ncbi:resolvase, partial [Bacteroides fragilis]